MPDKKVTYGSYITYYGHIKRLAHGKRCEHKQVLAKKMPLVFKWRYRYAKDRWKSLVEIVQIFVHVSWIFQNIEIHFACCRTKIQTWSQRCFFAQFFPLSFVLLGRAWNHYTQKKFPCLEAIPSKKAGVWTFADKPKNFWNCCPWNSLFKNEGQMQGGGECAQNGPQKKVQKNVAKSGQMRKIC